jgi:hypothetical protein
MAEEADEDPAAAAAAQAAAAASAATAFEKPQGGGTGSLLASQLAAQLAPWRDGAGGGPTTDVPLRITRNPDLRGPAPMFVRPPSAAKTGSDGCAASATGRSGSQYGETAAGSRGADAQQALDRQTRVQKAGRDLSSMTDNRRPEASRLSSGSGKTAAGRHTASEEAGVSVNQAAAHCAAHGDVERAPRRPDGRPPHRQRGGGSSASASPAVSRTGSPAPTQQARVARLWRINSFAYGSATAPASCTACEAYMLYSYA